MWSDGQKWCFGSCGYFVPGSTGLSVTSIREQLGEQPKEKKKNGVPTLPNDFSLMLRSDALAWLNKYGITDAERFKYKIGWSEVYESLVLPAFDRGGNLLLVQRRYFGDGPFEKYHTKGAPESVVWTCRPAACDLRSDPFDTYNGSIVLVEDYVSAIKVGRQAEVAPLWGSNLSMRQIKALSDRWEELILWLDHNKTKEALKFRLRALPYFNAVWVVSTEKDPKDHDDNDIRSFLDVGSQGGELPSGGTSDRV